MKISNTKKLVLSQFFEILSNQEEKDLEKAISKSLTEYKKVSQEGRLVNFDRDYLKSLKQELAETESTYNSLQE